MKIQFYLIIIPVAIAFAYEPYKDRTIAGVPCADAVLNMSHHDSDPKSKTGHLPIREHLDTLVKGDGIVLVFHKLTEGLGEPDEFYQRHLDEARDLGLMWGAYHFCRRVKYPHSGALSVDGARKQADHFIDSVIEFKAKKDTKILLAVDLEPYKTGRKIVVKGKEVDEQEAISLQDGFSLVERVYVRTGKWPLVYTGNPYLDDYYYRPIRKLTDPQLRTDIRVLLSICPLWYPEYNIGSPNLPKNTPWKSWALWQYTTNPFELKHQDCPDLRHLVGNKSGEFNYIAMERDDIARWFEKYAWDFKPPPANLPRTISGVSISSSGE
jgi:GH25 family lysozyme M1 (1,4-beta-N-acetylmuramidase)